MAETATLTGYADAAAVISALDKAVSSLQPGDSANNVSFTPADNIAATNVQAAIEELDDEKLAKAGGTMTGSLVLPDGSNTSPALHGSDADSGIYFSGNNIRFTSDGTNNFSLDSLCNHNLSSIASIRWTSSSPNIVADLSIRREGVSILGISSSDTTNAVESRLYGSFTSATNYHRLSQKSVRQAITAAAGATLVSTISIPKYSHLIGVTTRVTTALGTSNGTTGYTVGDGTDPDLWGVAATVTEGTTTDAANYTAADALGPDGSDRTITLTAVGGNFDGTGVIEVCAFYLRAEAD